jgi:hypothetical protein
MIKDQTFALRDGHYCVVNGKIFGTWETEALAKAGMAVEQRRAEKKAVR